MDKEKRFEIIYKQESFTESTRILRDRETGVCYLLQWSASGSGLTVLVDKDGKPIVMPD